MRKACKNRIENILSSSGITLNKGTSFVIVMLFCSVMAFANKTKVDFVQNQIEGKVTDETGQPLPGVAVLEVGSKNGVATDFDGNYTIVAIRGSVLSFSYMGMKTQSVIVRESKTINVVMIEDKSVLDEVIVIGYGSVKKSDITGSVVSIKPDENDALQSASINNLLQGKVAGLDVSSTTGTPGGAISVRIRGTNSLRSDNEPLYVVDGIIMNSITEGDSPTVTGNDFQTQQSGLTGINPSDVANIQVLKDASATAIYGSRGANGVIIITTKKGSSGKAKIKINHSVTASVMGNRIDLLGSRDFAEMANSGAVLRETEIRYGFYNGDIYRIRNVPEEELDYFLNAESASLTPELISKYDLAVSEPIDWVKEIAEISINTSNRLSVSGGKGGVRYYLAAGSNIQNGLLPNSNVKAGDIRSNLNVKISERFKISSTIAATYRTNDMNLSSDGTGNRGLMNSIINSSPLNDDFIDENGEPIRTARIWLTDYSDKSEESRIIASINADYKLFDFLTYRLKLSGNIRNKERVRFYTDQVGIGSNRGGYLGESNLVSKNYAIENLLLFNKVFAKRHYLNGTLGVTSEQYRATTKSLFGNDFSDFILREKGMKFAENVTYNNPRERPKNYLSGFARVNYTLDDKYLLTYTFRRDGVSVFSGDNQWDNFHSFALAWKIDQEQFIKNLDFVNQLKLRAGWGQTGNSSIAPFQTLDLYSPNQGSGYNGSTVTGLVPSGIPNPSLVWESTTQSNIGLDWGLLNGRFTGSVDTYLKTTERLLLNKPMPPSNGFTSTTVNVGEIENKGLEFMIDANIINKNNFKWKVGGNISFNKNKIVDLGDEDSFGDGRAHFFGNKLGTSSFTEPVNLFIENEPIGVFWGLKTNGLYRTDEDLVDAPVYEGTPQLGDIRFIDQNEDGVIDGFDKTIIGDPNPDFNYGVNTEISYKDLSLRVVFTGKSGNNVFNAKIAQNGYNDKLYTRNIYKETWINRWTPENTNGKYPRQGFNLADAADVLVEDGSYLRLSMVTLNYNLPKKLVKAIGIANASTYLTANNLYVFTNYRGFDPEVNSFAYDGTRVGIDWTSAPRPVSFTFGINIDF